jgi:hypothetical protein
MAEAHVQYDLPALHLDHDDLEDQFRRFKYAFNHVMVSLNVKPNEKAKRASNFIRHLPQEAQLIVADYDFVAKARSDQEIEDIVKAIVETKKKGTSQIMARHRLGLRYMKENEKFETLTRR